MDKLRGLLFDYGHTLVWFPKYKDAHLATARNAQHVLHDLGISIEISNVQALIERYASRSKGTSISMEEESKAILVSAGAKNFRRDDLRKMTEALWRPYVRNVRIRKGVKEALEYSKMMGLKLGIVANIWSGAMNPVLARLGIDGFFDTTVADMDVGFAKPDPRIFHLALDNLQLAPEQVVMVGGQSENRHKRGS
jgi:FMN phosphatase YigB (HAD superfamily)